MMRRFSGAVSMGLMLLVLSGCVSTQAYRTPYAKKNPAPNHIILGDTGSRADLFFVEFDDEGWMYGDAQLNDVLKELDSVDVCETPPIILTFAHGWKHNAKPGNENVELVSAAVGELARLVPDRRVIAVYVGWKGQSQPIPILQELGTFYSRKAAASRVGYTGASLLFGALERKKGELVADSLKCLPVSGDEKNRVPLPYMVSIGHSFGSLLTYSAYQGALPGRMQTLASLEKEEDRAAYMADKANMVVLLNTAMEASRAQPIMQIPDSSCSGRCKTMLLAVTAKSDLATRFAFILGQSSSELFANVGQRKLEGLSQWWASRQTLGHYKPFVTGKVDFEELPEGSERLGKCYLQPKDREVAPIDPEDVPRTFCGYTIWDHIDNAAVDNPRIQVLSAEEAVGDGHGLEVNLVNLMYLALNVIAEEERLNLKSR
ncbi:esterase/lipase/thioesterase family lipase [Oceanococcus atlanticus]|uniref:Esterase/lipase/thioesterase family lipase n=1 Tax=Oceanococcus atlanticus TaxID=1317117 RepID=A0A1Y1SII3_9GAMM|nr:hypothetical protein [Oceanococcus atlanticus]ORE89457.1 esterase/lipase/thioesterase family lipase [Oceanococcus atlanticus]